MRDQGTSLEEFPGLASFSLLRQISGSIPIAT